MAEQLLRFKDMLINTGKRLLYRGVPRVEKSVIAEPQVLYERDGILVVQLVVGRSIELQMSEDKRIVAAFRNCGLKPGFATQLMLGHLSGSKAHEEDQFTDSEHTTQTEHVVEKTATTEEGEVKIYDVDYYPAAARHADEPTIGIHTRDCELILGARGFGKLEIAPATSKNAEWVVHSEDMVTVPIKENTLAILPPNKQGNRWKFFDKGAFDRPGLEVKYVAFPGPYDGSTVKQAVIK